MCDDTETIDCDSCHVLNFITRRVNRVTKSTLHSEALSRVAATEDAIRISGWMDELYSPVQSTKDMIIKQETGKCTFPVDLVTDAKSLHEVIISPKLLSS